MSEATESVLQKILNGEAPTPVPSRRASPRYSVSYPILIECDRGQFESTEGVTINLARSGMLARLEGAVATGTRCSVTFLPLERFRPELVECPHCGSEFPVLDVPEEPIRATVVRVERADDGAVVAALMFEKPIGAVGDPA